MSISNVMNEYKRYKIMLKLLRQYTDITDKDAIKQTMSDIMSTNDLDRLVSIFDELFESCGDGSSRYVLKCGEYVIKVAKNVNGIIQNKGECEFKESLKNAKYDHTSIISEIYEADKYYRWVICEYCPWINEEEFKKYIGIEWDEWYKLERTINSNKNKSKTLEDINEFRQMYTKVTSTKKNYLINSLLNWLQDNIYNVMIDLGNSDSYGINHKGKLVLVDYGLDNNTYQNYFDESISSFDIY